MFIYRIQISDYVYIGSTKNKRKRKNDHLRSLTTKKHFNKKMQDVYNKHQKFSFDIIKNCENLEEMKDSDRWGTGAYHDDEFIKSRFIDNSIRSEKNYNCGVFGGKDYDFIEHYCDVALKTIFDKSNEPFWKMPQNLIDQKYKSFGFGRALLAEQYILRLVEKECEKDITFLMGDPHWKNMLDRWKNKNDEEFNFLHLWGNMKFDHGHLVDSLR